MTENNRIMVDIETLGTDPFCPILSIGACNFDPMVADTEDPVDHDSTFYVAITLESNLAAGLKPSADTINWWMTETSDAARQVFNDPRAVSLAMGLDMFTDWINSRPELIYANPPRFDMGIIQAAYKALGKEIPWSWRKERCYRTICYLAPDVVTPRLTVHHNALDDAKYQAYHLTAVYRSLGLKE
jgi:hypothetical protein